MGKILDLKINRWDGGIEDSSRGPIRNGSAAISHFDIFSNPYKMSPQRGTSSEASTVSVSDLKSYDLRHFKLGSNGKMYALGKNGSGFPQIMQKTDPTTGTWSAPATSTGNATRITGLFIEWASAFWFLEGTTSLSKWAIGSTVTDAVATLGSNVTTVAQGLIFGNNMFFGYNNKVVKVDSSGSVTDNVTPALPADMRITSLTQWGNYIMIGMAYGTSATASPTGRSKVFQWDGSSTTAFNDIIDWGEGALMCLGTIEGRVVGVTNNALETPSGLTSLAVGKGSMVIRMWAGGTPQVYKELVGTQSVTLGRMLNEVVIKNNKMYWVASVPFEDSTSSEATYYLGIWCFGRKNVNSEFALTLDYIDQNIGSTFSIASFGTAGNFWFINGDGDGSISITNGTATYDSTSHCITMIINFDDSATTKKLKGITLYTAPLPSGASTEVRYRKDEETSYTSIFTNSTQNDIRHSAINIESSGAELPEFKEIQFKILSDGGAEITGFKIRAETIEDNIY